MKTALLLLSVILSNFCNASTAQMTGNEMLVKCAPLWSDDTLPHGVEQATDMGYCAGYVAGVMDDENLWKNLEPHGQAVHYCLPEEGIPMRQVMRVIKKWLDEHPEHLNERADMLIHAALLQAFTCKK